MAISIIISAHLIRRFGVTLLSCCECPRDSESEVASRSADWEQQQQAAILISTDGQVNSRQVSVTATCALERNFDFSYIHTVREETGERDLTSQNQPSEWAQTCGASSTATLTIRVSVELA